MLVLLTLIGCTQLKAVEKGEEETTQKKHPPLFTSLEEINEERNEEITKLDLTSDRDLN